MARVGGIATVGDRRGADTWRPLKGSRLVPIFYWSIVVDLAGFPARVPDPDQNGDTGNMTGAMRQSGRQGQALALRANSLSRMKALSDAQPSACRGSMHAPPAGARPLASTAIDPRGSGWRSYKRETRIAARCTPGKGARLSWSYGRRKFPHQSSPRQLSGRLCRSARDCGRYRCWRGDKTIGGPIRTGDSKQRPPGSWFQIAVNSLAGCGFSGQC